MTKPVAIITGAGRGIGQATAVELSQRGYRIALAARNKEQLEQTLRLVQDGVVIPTDITQPDEVKRLVDQTLLKFSRIDAVVNNAGFAPMVSIGETSLQQWRDILETNLSAAFYMSRAVWPIFQSQRFGVIVNISSMASRDPFVGLGVYAAAKAGLNMLSQALSREGKELGIRVHTIAPGAVETGMFRELVSKADWPEEKTLRPEDVAAVIGECVCGNLRFTSGETIFLSKEAAN
jgi:NAD(P)-dependent dehydrogenase (short-subunit alcohol dehydrogenase family)